ncbi:hypothetical protein DVT68_00640 [Dyella solisilvae]|uniref:Uncharacterized protein n=1 Tax=Dyella solisilvae TaxID=1920168 RepID=A0A370K9V9_9GAMM|nr:hypothetical protein [Dyella solisilvae]RDI99405.1 hypothetical protein DVT68_00640 [Dyella solisilvae]
MAKSSDSQSGGSWFQTLPGVLTAVAGLLTAITGLVLGLNQAGLFRRSDPAPSPTVQTVQKDAPASDPVAPKSDSAQAPGTTSGPAPVANEATGAPATGSGDAKAPTGDSATVTSITPKPGTALSPHMAHTIALTIHYRLQSADSMILVARAVAFPADDGCSEPRGSHPIVVPDPPHITVQRGEGNLSVVLNIRQADQLKRGEMIRSVAAVGSFWSGMDGQGRPIVSTPQLWDARTTCFAYR